MTKWAKYTAFGWESPVARQDRCNVILTNIFHVVIYTQCRSISIFTYKGKNMVKNVYEVTARFDPGDLQQMQSFVFMAEQFLGKFCPSLTQRETDDTTGPYVILKVQFKVRFYAECFRSISLKKRDIFEPN